MRQVISFTTFVSIQILSPSLSSSNFAYSATHAGNAIRIEFTNTSSANTSIIGSAIKSIIQSIVTIAANPAERLKTFSDSLSLMHLVNQS